MAHHSPIGVAWVAEVNAAVTAHSKLSKRALSTQEVAALQAGGNRAADWSKVTLRLDGAKAFDPATVSRCTFLGSVELGTHAKRNSTIGLLLLLPRGLLAQ